MAFQGTVAIRHFLANGPAGRHRKHLIGWEHAFIQNVQKFAPDISGCTNNCDPSGHDIQAPAK
jgi:hypothetical protein